MHTSTYGVRSAAAVLALCALGATPALAESPETFVDAYGVHYDDPHQEHGGILLANPLPYCEGDVRAVALDIVNAGTGRTGYAFGADDGQIASQEESVPGGASMVSVNFGVGGQALDEESTATARVVFLTSTNLPEVVSFARLTHPGDCAGLPTSQGEAFDQLAVSEVQDVVTLYHRAGTGEPTDQGSSEGTGLGSQEDTGDVIGPRVQTGTGPVVGTAAPTSAGIGLGTPWTLAAAGLGALALLALAGRVVARR